MTHGLIDSESVLSTIVNKVFEQSGIQGVIVNSRTLEVFRKKVFCLQKAVKKASDRGGRQLNALLSKLETGFRYRFNIISISVSYSFVSFLRGFAFLTRVYVEYSLQNRFVFFFLWLVRHFEPLKPFVRGNKF